MLFGCLPRHINTLITACTALEGVSEARQRQAEENGVAGTLNADICLCVPRQGFKFPMPLSCGDLSELVDIGHDATPHDPDHWCIPLGSNMVVAGRDFASAVTCTSDVGRGPLDHITEHFAPSLVGSNCAVVASPRCLVICRAPTVSAVGARDEPVLPPGGSADLGAEEPPIEGSGAQSESHFATLVFFLPMADGGRGGTLTVCPPGTSRNKSSRLISHEKRAAPRNELQWVAFSASAQHSFSPMRVGGKAYLIYDIHAVSTRLSPPLRMRTAAAAWSGRPGTTALLSIALLLFVNRHPQLQIGVR